MRRLVSAGGPGPSQLGTGETMTVRFRVPNTEGALSYTYFPTGKVETIASSNPNGVSASYTWDNGGGRTLSFSESKHSLKMHATPRLSHPARNSFVIAVCRTAGACRKYPSPSAH
jgi:hypothetical protein